MNEIMLGAFVDEMEKIGGLSRSLRRRLPKMVSEGSPLSHIKEVIEAQEELRRGPLAPYGGQLRDLVTADEGGTAEELARAITGNAASADRALIASGLWGTLDDFVAAMPAAQRRRDINLDNDRIRSSASMLFRQPLKNLGKLKKPTAKTLTGTPMHAYEWSPSKRERRLAIKRLRESLNLSSK